MGKESSDISAIFNPRRVRAPSVVVTGDSPEETSNIAIPAQTATTPVIQHSDSLTSQHGGGDTGSIINVVIGGCNTPTEVCPQIPHLPPIRTIEQPVDETRWTRCKDSCCSCWAKKMYFGFCVTVLVTLTFVGATHAIKFLYLNSHRTLNDMVYDVPPMFFTTRNDTNSLIRAVGPQEISEYGLIEEMKPFNAPFFVSWFCTNLTILFFPIYLMGRAAMRKCGPGEILGDVLRGFRDRGFTVGQFINRSFVFCLLWLFTTYFYICSLKSLYATDVLALFSTNISCVYLLSWVILHEQFVGIRIVAVIMSDTGIALLGYMDGITGTPTLGGVVVAVLGAACYAVFKVMFRKMMGVSGNLGQIAFTFSFIGFLNAILLWPICIALYLSGYESMSWDAVSVSILIILSVLLLCKYIKMRR